MPRSAPLPKTIADIGEFGFLSKIMTGARASRDTIIGPGHDCAVVRCGGAPYLLTIDAMVDEVHFERHWLSPHQLGRKSFLVNASDIAAMGGTPRFCVVGFAVPPAYAARDLRAIQAGIVEAAGECGAAVVGGNMSRAAQLSITIALLGPAPRSLVTRRGARSGDHIYVTGTLGDAALAVRHLRQPSSRVAPAVLRRFREVTPRLRAGRALVEAGVVSAMMDVSDGLLQDLGHLCAASGVGAVIDALRLPLSRAYRTSIGDGGWLALRGGEDYELLCTVPERNVTRLVRMQRRLGCPITCVGRIVTGRSVRVEGLAGAGTDAGGYDHFRRRR